MHLARPFVAPGGPLSQPLPDAGRGASDEGLATDTGRSGRYRLADLSDVLRGVHRSMVESFPPHVEGSP